MGTEILRPQDCLIERIRVPPASIFPRRKSYNGNSNPSFNSNLNSNARSSRKPAVRADRNRFGAGQSEPSISKRSSSAEELRRVKNGMVMEKVTILRRGEVLEGKMKTGDASRKEGDDLVVVGTERLGPDPELVPKQIRIVDLRSPVTGKSDVYAGSAFFVSPAPSSLPFPSFSKKKKVMVSFDDSATRDLRRLLRLD